MNSMKICLLIKSAAVMLSAASLTACVTDRTATVLYDNEYSPLTQMSYSTTLPPETYSEYMATYIPPSETDTNDYYYSIFRNDGVIADTRVTAPSEENAERTLPQRDTAVPPADTAETRETTAETSVPDGFFTETAETRIAGASGIYTETAVRLERPEADTGMNEKAAADTMIKPTAPSEETTMESSLSE